VKPGYLLTLSLSIDDPARLWDAAATLAMASPGMTMEDVADTIGPRAAPNIDDCLALLLQPERFTGCALDTLAITRQRPPAAAVHAVHPVVPSLRYQPFDRLGSRHPVPAGAPFETQSLD
jgi:hypothetical protein